MLSSADLSDRDIRPAELAFGSDKTQSLFREMMDMASEEYKFCSDNTPLMIEAIPISSDGVMIIVTKVANSKHDDKHMSLLASLREARKGDTYAPPQGRQNIVQTVHATGTQSRFELGNDNSRLSIFSFGSIDEAANASSRFAGRFSGANALYKSDGRFYLLIHNNNPSDLLSTASMELILNEYGQKHISTPLSAEYLEEHGEIIIAEDAMEVLNSVYT
jgi:adapter protein MecA 1/2